MPGQPDGLLQLTYSLSEQEVISRWFHLVFIQVFKTMSHTILVDKLNDGVD